VHAILAARLGRVEKAYELYLRAARLDLDDYNREVHEGLHITSMAGSWLSVIEGFGGVRVDSEGVMRIEPHLPAGWSGLEFKLRFRGEIIHIKIDGNNSVSRSATPL
jgi:maltose phosphorylase